MCQGYSADALIGLDTNRLQGLKQMETEGILTLSETGIQLTEIGRPFLRNVCSWIDRYYGTEVSTTVQPVFSKAL